ncbi:MAG: SGNH/GDSL hydrolase family protein [Rikenellaceae bacterium]|nr:SGNH/GDSL hydrolase family protein [Rikenellaceae bacterium]
MANLKTFLFIFLTFMVFEVHSRDDLSGKKIAVIGDSYVRNHTNSIEDTWHYKFAQKYGMEYFNYGRNGNSIAYDNDRCGEGMYKRYKIIPDSIDYIVVIGGHNDSHHLETIGGIEQFREKMKILCEGLINKYPAAKIFFFTRWTCENFEGSNAEKVVDTMIEVCGIYGIPIFDSARKSGIHAGNEAFRAIYFHKETDDAHLNGKGHDRFLNVAENFILQY